jgi:ABC-2 type transport system permease protein
MLWYKAWLETRWRFLIGLALLLFSAGGVVASYPGVVELLPMAPQADTGSVLGRAIKEAAELAATYRGYVWSQWFGVNLPQAWTVLAVLLGTGGLLAQGASGGALFTLSLPITRGRLLGVRAATALLELLALALIPSLVIPLLSPTVGQSYAVVDVLVHAMCLFVGGSVFFSLAFLLSTAFTDVWRPLLIALCAAFALALIERTLRDVAGFGPIRVMTAEVYFRSGVLPWAGLLVSAAASGGMVYAAIKNIARQDF